MEGKLNPQALEENIRHLGEKKRKFFQYPKKKWSIPVSRQPITTHGPMVLFILFVLFMTPSSVLFRMDNISLQILERMKLFYIALTIFY